MHALHVNPGRLTDFIKELLQKLAGPEARAAFWFYRPIVLPVTAEAIGSASPFGSGSSLAGEGVLVQLTAETARELAYFFIRDAGALSALVHLEVESAGELQLRSYDSFEVVIPGPALDARWLASLIESGIVEPQ